MRLVKGAKETFGWVIVGEDQAIKIPPAAWERYQFQSGEGAIFLPGSRKSGGFGLTCRRLLDQFQPPIHFNRLLGTGVFAQDASIQLPSALPFQPGERLLTAFGSRYALGFISRGPIYEEALKHPDLESF